MSLVHTNDIAASVADGFDLTPNEAFSLVDDLLFDLDDEDRSVWLEV